MSAVTLRIGANLNPLRSALARAGNMLRSFGRMAGRVAGVGAVLGGAVAGFLTLRGAINGLRGAFDFGSQMDDFSARTGVAVGELVTLGEAFRQAGVSADQVPQAIQRMQRSLVQATDRGGRAADAFENIGLSLSEMRSMTAGQQFEQVARALGNIEDPAQRSAAAMEIFGRAGGELVTLFRDPEAMTKAARTLGAQAEVLEKNAGIFDRISDLLGGIAVKLRGFFIGIGERIAPLLLDVLERIDAIDLTAIGQRVGDALMLAMEAFKDGTLGELIWLAIKAGFETALNWINGTFVPAVVSAFADIGSQLADDILDATDKAGGFFGGHGSATPLDMARAERQRDRRQRRLPTTEAADEFSTAVEEMLARFRESSMRTQERVEAAQAERPPQKPFVPGGDGEGDDPPEQQRSLIQSLVSTFRRVGGEAIGDASVQRQAMIMQRQGVKATETVARNTQQTNALLQRMQGGMVARMI
jgi:hypothetical protein